MGAFRWHEEEKTWHLFDEKVGIHCYLHRITSPNKYFFIYTLVQVLLKEDKILTLQANVFSNILEALDYSEVILGYLPKFRDPNEDVYYPIKEEKC